MPAAAWNNRRGQVVIQVGKEGARHMPGQPVQAAPAGIREIEAAVDHKAITGLDEPGKLSSRYEDFRFDGPPPYVRSGSLS